MHDATPAQPQPLQRRQVVRLVTTSNVVAVATGFLASEVIDSGRGTLLWVGRVVLAVAAVAVISCLVEIRIQARLDRIEARLTERPDLDNYTRGYIDGVRDRARIQGD